MKTYFAKNEDIKRRWFLIDASNLVLGRLASVVATVLQGKHKPIYTPHADTGDYVVITNAKKIRVTGQKLEKKLYYKHSGYIGGMKTKKLGELLENSGTFVIKKACQNMLPKSILGKKMLSKLKIYDGVDHPHLAQNPITIEIKNNKLIIPMTDNTDITTKKVRTKKEEKISSNEQTKEREKK